MADGVTLRPSPEDAATRLFADLDSKTRAWALERYTPHPIAFRSVDAKFATLGLLGPGLLDLRGDMRFYEVHLPSRRLPGLLAGLNGQKINAPL